MRLFLVGGAVRDKLLGRPVKDRDWVVVGATPQQMIDDGFTQVGANFPVFLHGDDGEEYALARQERKTGPGYHGFETRFDPDVTIEEDLYRRDLTINAMAIDDLTGEIIDPYGGQEDLANGVLRHVSEAFAEDPVRVLRVARFAARYNFKVHEDTLALMRELVNAGELDHLTPERVWAEFEKAVGELHASNFFWVLTNCGAMEVLFPELDRSIIHTGSTLYRAALLEEPIISRMMIVFSMLTQLELEAVCARMKAPNDVKRMATKFIIAKRELLSTLDKPNLTLGLLKGINAFREPDHLFLIAKLMMFATNDHRAEVALQRLLGAYHATKHIGFMSLPRSEQEGLQGAEIGVAIDLLRIEAIANL